MNKNNKRPMSENEKQVTAMPKELDPKANEARLKMAMIVRKAAQQIGFDKIHAKKEN